jgi:hypothetical protein
MNLTRILNRLARIILLAIALFTVLPLASSVAQTYYVPSDSDHVQVLISGLKQNITLWKAGDVGVSVWGDVFCEGTIMSPARLNDTLSQLIAFTTERGMRPSGPSADQFGVFWDFQLDYTTMGFSGNVCSIPCTFSLFAGGSRKVSGLIECVKEDLNWRISRIDGLLPLLSAEALSVRRGTAAGHTSPTGASKRK